MARFETEWLATDANMEALTDLSGVWIDRVHARKPPDCIILDMDSSESPTHGEQEGSAYNGHFGCTCYHPLFVFNAFLHNAVRLQFHALAYNLANFLRTLALPADVEHWSLTTLREKLVKIGARVVRHGRYVVFQLAEVALPRALFAEIMRRIDRLRPEPLPA